MVLGVSMELLNCCHWSTALPGPCRPDLDAHIWTASCRRLGVASVLYTSSCRMEETTEPPLGLSAESEAPIEKRIGEERELVSASA
ncbi:hypothetical protein MPTK1_7g16660 [Marchantia polymorpha subsp. ruderalis]|uniref:Uncharacterized protein n=2 Tax=Marchantia polymorpha TaxID=3197 RepID=A0A176W0T9_MARPO|nr:hypothetical protein AXG93_2145s1050 [Marchantia polymorpha subsp. ruderalis]PTQ38367.1 hypothetical protein MARPO_0051s0004 [Marchantia polymorpha]BBN17741.1 hypothetical protein Mp_7g16660 [Marchantia polymorpha subsp. ruderalis]|eukprot:PTQ38367.1 hypothetical protein MARPO_0051s0004 [Marchantia polymorpha]